ncbi:hypothetical protein ACU635_61200 [[Actinomadura] parvosata]|uniref:hypothetical protein n=1 Tax=[Actinomadura] parvosata TaxID=1955412 RepID=UPI00406CC008
MAVPAVPLLASLLAARSSTVLFVTAFSGGPIVTVLGLVGGAQALAISRATEEDWPNLQAAESFLAVADAAIKGYAWVFGALTLVLAVMVWHIRGYGVTESSAAAAFVLVLPYFLVLLFACIWTPFRLGDSDEAVLEVVIEGPPWYLPSVVAVGVASVALMITGLARLTRDQRQVS